MSLNFSDVFSSFTTERYNKSNLIVYIAILIIAVLLATISQNFFFALSVLAFITVIYYGYYVLMSHNEAIGSKYIVPDINNFGRIITEGFKYLTGVSTIAIIINLPNILLITIIIAEGIKLAASGGSSLSLSDMISFFLLFFVLIFVFTIISIILTFKFLIPAKLLYMKTLNLSDMFSISQINKYGYMIRKDFWMYVLYFIILSILINVATQMISQIFSVFLINSNTLAQMGSSQQVQSIEQTFELFTKLIKDNSGAIIGFNGITTIVPWILSVLLMPNLNGQIIRNSEVSRTKKPHTQTEYTQYDV